MPNSCYDLCFVTLLDRVANDLLDFHPGCADLALVTDEICDEPRKYFYLHRVALNGTFPDHVHPCMYFDLPCLNPVLDCDICEHAPDSYDDDDNDDSNDGPMDEESDSDEPMMVESDNDDQDALGQYVEEDVVMQEDGETESDSDGDQDEHQHEKEEAEEEDDIYTPPVMKHHHLAHPHRQQAHLLHLHPDNAAHEKE
ncbi:hypothetical protein FOCC_FOCC016207 [Frankliniella occidentalis]|nr:hypothetical protein FOCC_FOCC016207 [Frankliniella occidentalis]